MNAAFVLSSTSSSFRPSMPAPGPLITNKPYLRAARRKATVRNTRACAQAPSQSQNPAGHAIAPQKESSNSFDQVGAKDNGLTLERLVAYARNGWRLSEPFFRDEPGAKWHFLLVLALTAAFSGFSVIWTMSHGSLMTAMSERSGAQITQAIIKLASLIAIVVPVSVLHTYVSNTFELRWQRYMTNRLLGLYFQARNYYKITAGAGGIDNPDEVLFAQISQFTRSAFSFIKENVRTVFDTLFYSVLLFRLAPSLFLVVIVLVVLSTLSINRIGRRLLAFEALHIKLSANFRFALARTRIFAESIAFYNGAKKEEKVASEAFNKSADCTLQIYGLQRFIDAFDRSFGYLPLMVPYAFLAPQYLNNSITMGHVTQSSSAFMTLAGNLSYYVERYQWLVEVGASLERLTRFVDYVNTEVDPKMRVFALPTVVTPKLSTNGVYDVDVINPTANTQDTPKSVISTTHLPDTDQLVLSNLTLLTPGSGRKLVTNLSINVDAGQRLLIVGPSGVGKTSLLRAIAGLWTSGEGHVKRSENNDCFFMPQRPYCVLGSLREQLTYPRNEDSQLIPSDEQLLNALSVVGLKYLADDVGLDAVQNWADVLSFGETQRIAFARLVLSDASLVIIDEGTSALDPASEEKVMRLVAGQGRIVVSVGHRSSLLKFHDVVLALKSDASWQITPAREYAYPTF